MSAADFQMVGDGKTAVLHLTGDWTVAGLPALEARTRESSADAKTRPPQVDASELAVLDTAGALLLISRWLGAAPWPTIAGLREADGELLKLVAASIGAAPVRLPNQYGLTRLAERVGAGDSAHRHATDGRGDERQARARRSARGRCGPCDLLPLRQRPGRHRRAGVLGHEARFPPPGSTKYWGKSTLAKLLENPVYTGDLVWNRLHYGGLARFENGGPTLNDQHQHQAGRNDPKDWVVVANAHEALVPRDTWEAAQRLRRARGESQGNARLAKRYALSCLIRCGSCGGPFVMRSTLRVSGSRDFRYCCNGTDPGRDCRGHTITEAVVESAVRRALHTCLLYTSPSPRD